MQEFFDSTWIQNQAYFSEPFQDICIYAYLLAPENFLFISLLPMGLMRYISMSSHAAPCQLAWPRPTDAKTRPVISIKDDVFVVFPGFVIVK